MLYVFVNFVKRILNKNDINKNMKSNDTTNEVKPMEQNTTDVVTLTLNQKAYAIAKTQVGVKEITGAGNNPKIVQYHQYTDLKATEDSVPWCSAFANWCFNKAGGKGTNSAAARSWLDWGEPVEHAREGDVVIFKSPLRGPDAGHVAFFVGNGSIHGFVKVLGGNQRDEVCYEMYPVSNIIGVRRYQDS